MFRHLNLEFQDCFEFRASNLEFAVGKFISDLLSWSPMSSDYIITNTLEKGHRAWPRHPQSKVLGSAYSL